MNKKYEAIHRYDFLTKELLEEEYITNKLTDKQIAQKYNMPSKVVVWRKRQKYGISNRFKNKTNKNASKNRLYHISKSSAEFLLQQGKTFKEISSHMGCSLMVAKRRFKELGLVKEAPNKTSSFAFYDVKLNEQQKQLLIGGTLGDGYLTKHNAFYCRHSEKQVEYILYKMKVLSSIHAGSSFYLKVKDPKGKEHMALSFTTGCNRFIEEIRPIFYKEDKIFPNKFILDNLTPQGLAYWYMDDGTFSKKNHTSKLHTEGFSFSDNKLIVDFFRIRFSIDTRICTIKRFHDNRAYNQYNIYFPRKSTVALISLVEPYIIPTMRYKIGL